MEDDKQELKFYQELKQFVEAKQIEYPNPILMSRSVDLFRMYKSVQERGGYSTVTRENSWKFVFLDCTDAPNYSSNTGYYTRLSYEKNILDFDRSRANPFPRIYKKDEEKMMVKKRVHNNNGSNHGGSNNQKNIGNSSSSAISDGESEGETGGGGGSDSESEIDTNELDQILEQFSDYEKQETKVNEPPPLEDEQDREKWFESVEEKLRWMQKQHKSLQKYLIKIDKKLGHNSREGLVSGVVSEGIVDESRDVVVSEGVVDESRGEDETMSMSKKRRESSSPIQQQQQQQQEGEYEVEDLNGRRKKKYRKY